MKFSGLMSAPNLIRGLGLASEILAKTRSRIMVEPGLPVSFPSSWKLMERYVDHPPQGVKHRCHENAYVNYITQNLPMAAGIYLERHAVANVINSAFANPEAGRDLFLFDNIGIHFWNIKDKAVYDDSILAKHYLYIGEILSDSTITMLRDPVVMFREFEHRINSASPVDWKKIRKLF